MTRRYKPTGRPRGQPRKLTPAQELELYAAIESTRRGRRRFVYVEFAHRYRVCIATVERAATRARKSAAQGLQVAGQHRSPLLADSTNSVGSRGTHINTPHGDQP